MMKFGYKRPEVLTVTGMNAMGSGLSAYTLRKCQILLLALTCREPSQKKKIFVCFSRFYPRYPYPCSRLCPFPVFMSDWSVSASEEL